MKLGKKYYMKQRNDGILTGKIVKVITELPSGNVVLQYEDVTGTPISTEFVWRPVHFHLYEEIKEKKTITKEIHWFENRINKNIFVIVGDALIFRNDPKSYRYLKTESVSCEYEEE